MAIIKPEQLSSGTYSISGSFSGSFHGDGSDLNNLPQEILKYSSSINFPQPSGSTNYLYLDQSANNLYSWDTTVSQYVILNNSTVPSPSGSPEGTLYFADLATSARLAPNTYDNGISGSGATLTATSSGVLGQFNQPGKIDNITPLASDIILVKNELTSSRNGLYSITNLGSPSSSYVLTRVSYYDTGSEIYPSQITVLKGTTAANQTYIQQTDNPTVGSSSIVFSQSPSTATQTIPVTFMDTVTTGPLPSSSYATGSSYIGFPGYQATITSTTTGSLGVIGGITASSNIRILVVSQSNSVQNGSYTVTSPGSSTTPWRLTRIDYWTSMQPNFKEFVISRFGATEYGSRYVLQSSSITNTNIGISQSLIFQKYLSPSSGSGGSTPSFPFTGSALITGSLGVTGSVSSTQGFTGSLLGTASLASTASFVVTAQTASYVLNAVSSSFATTASYALNALSASYAPPIPPVVGPFGISNSSGSYTYYTSFSSSMAAAISGQTIEIFADITESSAVTITCKDNVKINGNGHTYKCTSNGVNLRLFTNVSNGECYINNLTIEHTSSHSNSATVYLLNGSFDLTGTIIKKDSGFGVQIQGGKLYNGVYIGTGTTTGVINQGGEIFRCTSYCVNGKAINNITGNAYSIIGVTTGTGNGIEGVNVYKGTGIAYGNAYGAFLSGNCHNIESFSAAAVGVYLGSGNYSNITGISNGNFGAQNQGNNCFINNLRAISTVSNGFFTQSVTGVVVNGGLIQSSTAITISSNSGLSLNNIYVKNTWNNIGGHGLITGVDEVEVINCIFDLTNTSANCLTALTAKIIKYTKNAFRGATTPVNANITQGMINTQDNQGNIII